MLKKNIFTDDIFYYIPKINNLTRNENIINGVEEKEDKEKKSIIFSFNGSSTFDYLNDLNRDKYKLPKLKDSFLTKNMRNKKIQENIEKTNIFNNQIINPLHKLRLSHSCELFSKLTKTFMIDKNSLKSINNKVILFENNNINDDIVNNNNNNNIITLSKFNNLFIKKSLSNDKKNILLL